jgi:hypothetical protein
MGSGASVAIACATFASEQTNLLTVLLWNFYLAGVLAAKGILPVCANCELVTVFEIIFWAFAVGVIGYTSVFFGLLQLRSALRKRSLR